MKSKEQTPSEIIQEFLSHIDQWQEEYKAAYDKVGMEDKRLQDLLHEMEFSKNAKERNRVATKLHNSRKVRRENKDKVLMLENVVQFFGEQQNRKTLNQLTQLLGKQRKQEKVLLSQRTYIPRVEEVTTGMNKVMKQIYEGEETDK